jgi:hypothetical protein
MVGTYLVCLLVHYHSAGAPLFLPCVGLTSFWLWFGQFGIWPILQILDLCTSARFGQFCIWSILNSKPGAKQSLRNLSQFVRLVPRGGTEHHGADPTIGPVMGKARDFGTCTLSDTRLHVEEKVLHVKRPLGVSEGHSGSTARRPHRHRVSAAPSESNNSPSSACTVEPLIAAWLKFSLYG